MAYYVLRNLSTYFDLVEPYEFDYLIEGNESIEAFTLKRTTNKIIAAWQTGFVEDCCNGIPTKIKLPFIAKKVIAFNVLNGEYTELKFVVTDSETVVADILLRDYPLFIEIW